MLVFSGAVGSPVDAAGWDVCTHGCRYSQIGPALTAARDGESIRVGPGVYRGGLTIAKSVQLVGAGRHSTVIRGGGPVVTIGTVGAATPPTVAIRGVTLMGGVSRTGPLSGLEFGEEGVVATGGGVEVPWGADFGLGATVSIEDSAIIGNRVAPVNARRTGPSVRPVRAWLPRPRAAGFPAGATSPWCARR